CSLLGLLSSFSSVKLSLVEDSTVVFSSVLTSSVEGSTVDFSSVDCFVGLDSEFLLVVFLALSIVSVSFLMTVLSSLTGFVKKLQKKQSKHTSNKINIIII